MAKQATTYVSGVTAMAMGLAIVPLLVALWLIWNGVYYLNKFPGPANLPWLVLFSIVPLAFGIGIIAVTAGVMKKNSGRRVSIGPEGFSYEDGDGRFTLKWGVTAHSMPKGKLYRVMAVTDGKNVARIEEIFFADFDEIARQVIEAKGR
jgi:hypothetical protein